MAASHSRMLTCVSRALLASSWLRVMLWLLAMVCHDHLQVQGKAGGWVVRWGEGEGCWGCNTYGQAGRPHGKARRRGRVAAAGGSLWGAKKVTARLGLEKRAL